MEGFEIPERGGPSPVQRFLSLVTVFVLIAVVVVLSITGVCGLIFQCGFTLSEGMLHCNAMEATGPHCPWCSHGKAGFYAPLALILTAMAGTVGYANFRYRPPAWLLFLAGLLSYAFWASVVGLGSALYHGYPVFYGMSIG